MNRITQLHAKSAHKTAMVSIENGKTVGSEDFNKAHAAATAYISCSFAEWISMGDLFQSLSDGLWYSKSDLVHYDGFTTAQLFEEFCKTI